MKTLNNGEEVPARMYYYLLDYNDTGGKHLMFQLFNKDRLFFLTKEEFLKFFKTISEFDLENIS